MLHLDRLLICTGAIFALTAFTSISFGQGNESWDGAMNARDAFWSAEDLVSKPKPHGVRIKPPAIKTNSGQQNGNQISMKAPLGLRYSVLEQRPDGTLAEVSPETMFHAGDKIRLSVMSNQEGYLYIIEQGSSGSWIPLHPRPGASGANKLVPGQEYIVPGKGFWQFAGEPGQERIFVLLTREPEIDLDQTIKLLADGRGNTPAATDTISNQLLDRVRSHVQSRDLVFTDPDEPGSADDGDKAKYVVNKASKAPDPHVRVDVVLSHQ